LRCIAVRPLVALEPSKVIMSFGYVFEDWLKEVAIEVLVGALLPRGDNVLR